MRTRLRIAFASLALSCALAGCATRPTQTQAIALDAGIQAAVSITIQNGTADPAVWAAHAGLIVSIVDQIRPLVSDSAVNVPQLAAAVNSLVSQAHLAPEQQVAASILVQSLARMIKANVDPASPQAASVLLVLDTVRAAASVYLPLTS